MDKVARIALPVGAVGSVGFMLQAGRHSPPILLLIFGLWALSPFIILAARATFHWLRLLVALGSLIIYASIALGPAWAKIGTVFLLVPTASLLLIAIVSCWSVFFRAGR